MSMLCRHHPPANHSGSVVHAHEVNGTGRMMKRFGSLSNFDINAANGQSTRCRRCSCWRWSNILKHHSPISIPICMNQSSRQIPLNHAAGERGMRRRCWRSLLSSDRQSRSELIITKFVQVGGARDADAVPAGGLRLLHILHLQRAAAQAEAERLVRQLRARLVLHRPALARRPGAWFGCSLEVCSGARQISRNPGDIARTRSGGCHAGRDTSRAAAASEARALQVLWARREVQPWRPGAEALLAARRVADTNDIKKQRAAFLIPRRCLASCGGT